MLASPPARGSKAIHLPSGDQRGVPVTCIPNDDNWMGLEPSASHTQTSVEPVRSDEKGIFDPSGEMLGATRSRDKTINLSALGGKPFKSSRHIFVLVTPCTYTRRCANALTAMSSAPKPKGSFWASPGRASEGSQRLPASELNKM